MKYPKHHKKNEFVNFTPAIEPSLRAILSRDELLEITLKNIIRFAVGISVIIFISMMCHLDFKKMALLVFAFIIFYVTAVLFEKKRFYREFELVPAVIVNLSPLTIVALANISRNDFCFWALTQQNVKSLPNTRLELYARIPCCASFKGRRDNTVWDWFTPHPLCWATDDVITIKSDEYRIIPEKWEMLYELIAQIPDKENTFSEKLKNRNLFYRFNANNTLFDIKYIRKSDGTIY
jgi:hypothetical protein